MINFSEIVTDFRQAHQNPVLIPPVKIQLAGPDRSFPRQYIYSWKALPELINQLRKVSKNNHDLEEDRNDRLGLRYAVDRNGNAWFAREGEESSSVPTHSEMVDGDYVQTSGSIFFSEDYKTIVEITNKSGHFLPEFQTIVSFLTILFSLENNPEWAVSIAPKVTLVNYRKSESKFAPDPTSSITVPKRKLQFALNKLVAPVLVDYPFARLRKIDPENKTFTMFEIFETHEQYTAHKNPPVREKNILNEFDLDFNDTTNPDDPWSWRSINNGNDSILSDLGMFSSNMTPTSTPISSRSWRFPIKRTHEVAIEAEETSSHFNLLDTLDEVSTTVSTESDDNTLVDAPLINCSLYTVSDNSLFTRQKQPTENKRLRKDPDFTNTVSMNS